MGHRAAVSSLGSGELGEKTGGEMSLGSDHEKWIFLAR